MIINIQQFTGRHQEYNFRPVMIDLDAEDIKSFSDAKSQETAHLIAEELLRNPDRVDVISYWRCEQTIPEYQCWVRYRASVSDTDYARSIAGRWYPLDNGIKSLSVATAVYKKSSMHFSWKNSADVALPNKDAKHEDGTALNLPYPDGDQITAPRRIDLIEGGTRDIIEAPFSGFHAEAIKHHGPKTPISPPIGFFGPHLGEYDDLFRGFGPNPYLLCKTLDKIRAELLERACNLRERKRPMSHKKIYSLEGFSEAWSTQNAFERALRRYIEER